VTGTRFLAAIVALAIVLPVLIWGEKLAVGLLIGAVLVIAQDEFAGMAAPQARARMRATLVVTGGMVHASLLYAPPGWALPAMGLAVIVALLVPMFAQADLPKAGEEAARTVMGTFYAPVLMAPLALIHARRDGLALLTLLFVCTWAGDTGAYFAGRAFGKHKMFERISPNKTWEGFAGGLALSIVGAAVVNALMPLPFTWLALIPLAAVLDIAGVVGDLAESMLKRAWGVKDSGWIMPGHGGILDRVDSLLFTGPVMWAALQLAV
jgi:phosphatidate cytidylyltransferase